MGKVNGYMFELVWLVIVMLLFAVAPVRTQDPDAWTHDEIAGDCPERSGLCWPGI